MRLFVVLIAVVSLVVRWGDAACGCAAHHRLAPSQHVVADDSHGEHHGSHEHGHRHDHDGSDPGGPVIGHGCEGHAGAAIYAVGDRLPPGGTASVQPSEFAVVTPQVPAGWNDAPSPSGPPSRAALNVYRI